MEDEDIYQLWFAAKVAASLDDQRPPADHETVMSELDAIIDRAGRDLPFRTQGSDTYG